MSQNTTIVPGANYVGYCYDGGLWKPYICARDLSTSVDTDTVETTVPGDGDWKSFEATVNSFTASASGVISAAVAGSLSLAELQALQFSKTKLLWRMIQTSVGGSVYRKEAYFYITNSTDTGSFDGIATFQLSLRGTGKITQIFTPPIPPTPGDMRYPQQGAVAPATTGAYTWDLPGINPSNARLTNVVKDGRGSNNIILSGTPVGNEVLFEANGSDGLLTWAFPFEDGETPPYITYNQI